LQELKKLLKLSRNFTQIKNIFNPSFYNKNYIKPQNPRPTCCCPCWWYKKCIWTKTPTLRRCSFLLHRYRFSSLIEMV